LLVSSLWANPFIPRQDFDTFCGDEHLGLKKILRGDCNGSAFFPAKCKRTTKKRGGKYRMMNFELRKHFDIHHSRFRGSAVHRDKRVLLSKIRLPSGSFEGLELENRSFAGGCS
jgi:hypothetical protein